ncbi:MAG: hypothetical protein RL696_487 [Actinomycetota bacterium]|jgi:DivIVA domain-containing protein
MSFPLTSAKLQGYDPGQVDALLSRVGSQLANPERRLVTAPMLAVARFDLVLGGYQIPAVDQDLARLADDLEIAEISRLLARYGKARVASDLAANLRTIKQVLEQEPKQRFDIVRDGYEQKRVGAMLKRVIVKRSSLTAPKSFELRTSSLGRSGSGFERSQVDEFLALVVTALHQQEILS